MRIDPIAQTFIFLAGAIIVYLAPYGVELFTPLALLTVSVSILYVMGKRFKQDTSMSSGEKSNVVGYTILGLVLIMAANMAGSALFQMPVTDVIFMDALLFGVLYGIVEEVFFRGVILQTFMWKTKNFFIAILLSSVLFWVYHIKRYGTGTENMIMVLAAGVIMGMIAWRSRRLSPVILIHVLNNIMAVMMT